MWVLWEVWETTLGTLEYRGSRISTISPSCVGSVGNALNPCEASGRRGPVLAVMKNPDAHPMPVIRFTPTIPRRPASSRATVFPNTSGEHHSHREPEAQRLRLKLPRGGLPAPVRRPPRAQCRFSLLDFSTCNGYSKFIWRIIQRQHWGHSGIEQTTGAPSPPGVTLSHDMGRGRPYAAGRACSGR